MGLLLLHHPFLFVLGILGNIFSALVYLAPVPTFYRVYRNRTTEQFQSTPYVVALMNALLWIYYSILVDAYPLLSINVIGAVLRIAYILIFVRYADQSRKMQTVRLTGLLNIALVSVIVLLTVFLTRGSKRILIVGWICVGSGVSAFAAPLTLIRHVIRTRSAEFMPLPLSVFLTLSAAVWTVYGVVLGDIHIIIASALGFLLGVVQITLYMIFRNPPRSEESQGPAVELEA